MSCPIRKGLFLQLDWRCPWWAGGRADWWLRGNELPSSMVCRLLWGCSELLCAIGTIARCGTARPPLSTTKPAGLPGNCRQGTNYSTRGIRCPLLPRLLFSEIAFFKSAISVWCWAVGPFLDYRRRTSSLIASVTGEE